MHKVTDTLRPNFWANALAAGLLMIMLCWATTAAGQSKATGQRLVPAEKIRSAVEGYVVRHAPWDPKQMQIKRINFNTPLKVPAGELSLQVSAPKNTDWIGAVAFTVDVLVNGQKSRRVTVPANIEVWGDAVLSAKPLGKYQPIGQDDLQIKKMNLARVPANAVLDMDQVLGYRTKRNIAANTILRSDHVERPPVVKRGDIVQVIAESPLLTIAVRGMVQQKGAKGDRVKVVNLRSKKTIYAQVVDGQTVRVDF